MELEEYKNTIGTQLKLQVQCLMAVAFRSGDDQTDANHAIG